MRYLFLKCLGQTFFLPFLPWSRQLPEVPCTDRPGSRETGTGSSARPFWDLPAWWAASEHGGSRARPSRSSAGRGMSRSCCQPASTRTRSEGLWVRRHLGNIAGLEHEPLLGKQRCSGLGRGSWRGLSRCSPRPSTPSFRRTCWYTSGGGLKPKCQQTIRHECQEQYRPLLFEF